MRRVQSFDDGVDVRRELLGKHHHLVELRHVLQEVRRARALEHAPAPLPAPVGQDQRVVQVEHQRVRNVRRLRRVVRQQLIGHRVEVVVRLLVRPNTEL